MNEKLNHEKRLYYPSDISLLLAEVSRDYTSPHKLNRILSRRGPEAAFFDRIDLVTGLMKNLNEKEKYVKKKLKKIKDSKMGYVEKLRIDKVQLVKNANEVGLEVIKSQKKRVYGIIKGNLEQFEEYSNFLFKPEIKEFL